MNEASAAAWRDASLAAALFAVAPAALGGVSLRCGAGPVRDRWLSLLTELLPEGTPLRRMPHGIGDERLLGGLDLPATLRSGRPVAQRGLLAEVDGGVLLLPMAERIPAGTAARLAAAIDRGEVQVARDGIEATLATRFGVVAFDEGGADDDPLSAALAERLAVRLDLTELGWRDVQRDTPGLPTREDVTRARAVHARVRTDDAVLEALSSACVALGIGSARAPWLALQVARIAAALAGRDAVAHDDAELAARLVLGPRATQLPAPPEAEPQDAEPPPPPAPEERAEQEEESSVSDAPLEEQVLAAAQAAIPPGLLARLKMAQRAGGAARSLGRSGQSRLAWRQGRPAGVRAGAVQRGARLNLIETLRAAAPWQALRRREGDGCSGVAVRPEDFRVTRYKQKTRTTTIFAIDASGSSALHRLAEAKGAVELLLADCYVRRDQVAVLAFRGSGAELLLPPTRSLVRAKRSLAGLPGGGGTPLAAGLDAAWALAEGIARRGDTPLVVLLTDGRANIGRDGRPDRARAEQDALKSAERWRGSAVAAVVVDTSARPEPRARALAQRMDALYLPLPHARADTLKQAVQAVARGASGR
jgi:magnesium chelatase subunit D